MVSRPSEHPHDRRCASCARLEARIQHLQAQLARARRANDAFREVASELRAPIDLDRLLEVVLEKSVQVLEADRATLYLIDDKTGDLMSRMVVGGKVQSIRVMVGEGIAGAVVKTGKPIRVADAYADRRFSREWDAVTGYCTRSILAVPMKSHVGQTIGVLQALNKKTAEAFTAEDESLLASLATQAAISVDNMKLFLSAVQKNADLARTQYALERRVADLNLLFELESTMARATTQTVLVHRLLERTVNAMRSAAGAMLIVDAEGNDYHLFGLSRETPDALTTRLVPEPLGLLGMALGRAEPLLVDTLRRRKDKEDVRALGFKARAAVAVALGSDEPIGALALFDRDDGPGFTRDDAEMLRLVAANAATALTLLRSREAQQVSDRLSTIGRLLSGVIHDLKTPMAVISGYAQLLASTEEADQRKSFADLILKQVDHVTAMQKEVLAFARGERTLFVTKVYVQKFFDEIRSQIEREIEGRPVTLTIELRDRGTARIDEAKMTRALHNLARNAVDAMGPKGGKLTLFVEREDEALILRVRDTGPGIPREIQASLFRHFVTAGKARGTGLGLAIVRKVVEEHGGTVSFVSSSKGAEFVLRLPQA